MYEIPSCGKFTDQWQTDFFPSLNFHDATQVVDSTEKAAAIGDMMAWKKFKA